MANYPKRLAWIDLEATGLPVGNDYTEVHLLEIAVIVTDLDLNKRVGYVEVAKMTPEAAAVVRSNKFVRDMHALSGLLRDSIQNATLTTGEIEAEIIDLFQEEGEPGDFMIAGSGVAAYDHPWIKHHMPDLNTWLVYYPFDIGVMRRTSKILAGREIVSHTSMSYGDEKTHRALDDIQAHLEEARKYQAVFREVFPRCVTWRA